MTPAVAAFSVGARAAGVVFALAYLLGFVDGPVVAVMGGLGLIALGRTILLTPRDAVVAGAAFAILAGALGVAALRWGVLELGGLRGAQAVLGPTILVGPPVVAVASWGAAIAALGAAGLWLSRPLDRNLKSPSQGGEIAVTALAIATAFWGPALTAGRTGAGDIGAWAVALAIAASAVGAVALLLARGGLVLRGAMAGISGVAVVGAAAAVAGTL